jgi:hypothetical protein
MDENTTDQLAFLAEQSSGEKTGTPPGPQSQPQTVETATEGGSPGSHGEVIAETPEAVDSQSAVSAPIVSPEPGHVPLSALLDEREKRRTAERRAAELEAKQEPAPQLSPTDLQRSSQYQLNLRVSRKFAEQEYGKDTVALVHDWAFEKCNADAIFNQQIMASDDPYEAAYQAYSRDRVLSEVQPSDLEEFKAWKAVKAGVQAAQAEPTTRQHQPATPLPRSLATAPGNGGPVETRIPVGDGHAFSAAFNR